MTEDIFTGKTIALGVSGGIAAYKAVDLASKLTQVGATVKTIMTKNATQFVGPVTFRSVTGQPVITGLFNESGQGYMHHIAISEGADLLIVAPATANIIAKAAHGLADDALSTSILAARRPVVMAPAMNNHMWHSTATQHNLSVLRERGIHVIEPDVGRLACGEEQAAGRLPETGAIVEYLAGILAGINILKGKTVLVTAGGTHEPIDPVRFIGNRSSGKMGYAVAEAARIRGADVILVTGPTCLAPPYGVAIVPVETAEQMHEAVLEHLPRANAVVMAAAVADFRPVHVSDEKIKKEEMGACIELARNPDILRAVTEKKDGRIVVGFAAESENVIDNAVGKLQKKNLDLIVANDIGKPGVGFGSDVNLAVLIDTKGPMGDLITYKKTDLAAKIVEWVAQALTS